MLESSDLFWIFPIVPDRKYTLAKFFLFDPGNFGHENGRNCSGGGAGLGSQVLGIGLQVLGCIRGGLEDIRCSDEAWRVESGTSMISKSQEETEVS